MFKQTCRRVFEHKKVTAFVLLAALVGFSGFDYARGDTGKTDGVITTSAMYLVVFITAGVIWSLSGFINNIRSHANYDKTHPGTPDPDWKGFEVGKMKDDVFIGLILGALAFVLNATSSIPEIATPQAFFAAVVSSYGLIGLTDKIGVGAILNH